MQPHEREREHCEPRHVSRHFYTVTSAAPLCSHRLPLCSNMCVAPPHPTPVREAKSQKRAANRANKEETPTQIAAREEREENKRVKAKADVKVQAKHDDLKAEEEKNSKKRLEYLLSQSDVFRKLNMGNKKKGKNVSEEDPAAAGPPSPTRHARDAPVVHEGEEEEDTSGDAEAVVLTEQPSSIEFGQMKPYQITGLNWMIHLRSKGLSGILADEMGLGKTLQSISILAYLWEYERESGPSLIVVPKSTISNWMNELARWCPSLRAVKFHGSKEER